MAPEPLEVTLDGQMRRLWLPSVSSWVYSLRGVGALPARSARRRLLDLRLLTRPVPSRAR